MAIPDPMLLAKLLPPSNSFLHTVKERPPQPTLGILTNPLKVLTDVAAQRFPNLQSVALEGRSVIPEDEAGDGFKEVKMELERSGISFDFTRRDWNKWQGIAGEEYRKFNDQWSNEDSD